MIDVIGMGADGPRGLAPEPKRRLDEAELVVASPRLHGLMPTLPGTRIEWPTPIPDAASLLQSRPEARIAGVVSGDPLWHSVGNLLARAYAPDACRFHPHVSSFQIAACRLGWAMSEVACATVHGRAIRRIAPLLGNRQRILLFTSGGRAPAEIAQYLVDSGYGATRLTVLANLGGPGESRRAGVASEWSERCEEFHVLALEVRASGRTLAPGRAPGLPDSAFRHDGQLTKRNVRSITLAKLRPMPGELLWDLGCGCGSVAIEWLRGAPGTRAIGVDRTPERLELTRRNAEALGADGISLIEGDVHAALDWPEAPDAVFIGGGLSPELIDGAWSRLRSSGRLVANCVTWDSQRMLHAAYERLGGTLSRHSVETFGLLGGRGAWLPSLPVTQWSVEKFREL